MIQVEMRKRVMWKRAAVPLMLARCQGVARMKTCGDTAKPGTRKTERTREIQVSASGLESLLYFGAESRAVF
jgi:hypothetical protein